jgi:bleomycin hydrolase
MTIGGLSLPKGGGPLPRKLRSKHVVFDGFHAVQIVGYDLDRRTGKIVKFKIKNSWGDKAGSGGYYHMYLDYFRAFAFSLVAF